MGAAAAAVGRQSLQHGLVSAELGTFSGSLAWPICFRSRSVRQVTSEAAFDGLARRWLPVLNACDEQGIGACYEIHPCEDLHDGVRRFGNVSSAGGEHPRCQVLFDPQPWCFGNSFIWSLLIFIKDVIGMFHARMPSLIPPVAGASMVAITPWIDRAGRFRSLGDGSG